MGNGDDLRYMVVTGVEGDHLTMESSKLSTATGGRKGINKDVNELHKLRERFAGHAAMPAQTAEADPILPGPLRAIMDGQRDIHVHADDIRSRLRRLRAERRDDREESAID